MEPNELYKALEEQYFGENSHEQGEMDILPGLLKGVSLFVDVGASLGPYSFAANKVLANGEIVCIEADPVRIKRLAELAETWQKTSSNKISVIHAAAADQPGKMDFFVTDACISGALFKHHVPDSELSNSLHWSTTEVEVVTLDALFKERDPDLVKIDVEGAEYRVILGSREILKRGKTRFLVEVHPWGDEGVKKTPADVYNLFAEFGYDFRRTHRHWLFEKTGHPIKRFLKNRAIVFIENHPWLKQTLKRIILASSKYKHR